MLLTFTAVSNCFCRPFHGSVFVTHISRTTPLRFASGLTLANFFWPLRGGRSYKVVRQKKEVEHLNYLEESNYDILPANCTFA